MSSMSSRGVLWEVVRPVLAWPMRSPLRLGLVCTAVLIALVVAVQVTGRAGEGQDGTDQVAATAPPGTPAPTLGAQLPADPAGQTSDHDETGEEPAHDHGHDHDEALESSVPLEDADPSVLTQEPETEAEQDAVSAGVAAVRAMTRPGEDVEEQDWWEAFAATLTDQARDDYQGIDPQAVPWTQASTEGVLVPMDEDHAHLARFVQVDTDRGPVLAHVARDGQDGWAVSRVEWEWEQR